MMALSTKTLRAGENGPLKMRSHGKFCSTFGISHHLLKGLGVSNFVSVGHIFAFLSSHYTFSSRARILKRQSRRLGESRIYHSPPLLYLVCEASLKNGYSVEFVGTAQR